MISGSHVISRVGQVCLALAVAAASMVFLAQPASAQARRGDSSLTQRADLLAQRLGPLPSVAALVVVGRG